MKKNKLFITLLVLFSFELMGAEVNMLGTSSNSFETRLTDDANHLTLVYAAENGEGEYPIVGFRDDEPPCLPQRHGMVENQSAICGGELISQLIELAEDWNWFSTYIDGDPVELIAQLEESLGEYGIQIEQYIDGVTENQFDGSWFGDLDDIGMTTDKMYMIQVSADCTAELTGAPVDPSTVEITLAPNDWTWIGYPCSEEVDILVALSGLEPEVGDQIENFADGISEYQDDGTWFGMETFVPGQGYMYYSNSDEEKTFYFQTGSSKAKH